MAVALDNKVSSPSLRRRLVPGRPSWNIPLSFCGDRHCKQQLFDVAWLCSWSESLLWPIPNSLSSLRPCSESPRPCRQGVCKRAGDRAGPETWTTTKVALKLVKKPSSRTMGIRTQQQKCFDYAKFRDCEPPKDGICSYRPSFHKLRFGALNRTRTRQPTPDILSEQEDREISKNEIRGTSSWHSEMW